VPGAPAGVTLSGMLLPPARRSGSASTALGAASLLDRTRFGHYLLHVGELSDGVFMPAADLRPDPENPERCASARPTASPPSC